MIATASYGLTLLETDFKSVWYIRSGTYVKQFLEARDDLFPTGGISGSVYIAYVNLAKEMGEAERLSRVSRLQSVNLYFTCNTVALYRHSTT